MNRVALWLWNPIVAKEYRSRMRGLRSPVALVVYIVLLAGLGWAIFAAMSRSYNQGGGAANYGQELFLYLSIFQMLLLAFFTPAVTAGAISGERERQTIDLLFVTMVRPFAIIWGKLLASISFILLLLVISVPIFSFVFLFGGIELDQVLHSFLVTAATALTLGTIGILFSTWFPRTLAATVAAYAASFALVVGTPVYGLLFPVPANPASTVAPAPPVVTYLGPIVPLVAIALDTPVSGYGVAGGSSGGSGVACSSTGPGAQTCYPTGPSGQVYYSGQATTGPVLTSGPFAGWLYWQATVAMQLALCVLALALAALALPPVGRLRRWRALWRPPGGDPAAA